ncbi:helix-turn-helix transcriptional regulator [Halobaculum gomorrense]|uniref:Predicted transcriptional regulator, contains HTH domain n=1 Tax=Halobaculum gomorrense TaxID=43928 RepID=A0A1M5MQL6_9EURY|nr:MarR family transcriptional regulator [Halobaculum gomorrense]SHG79073.1 Predicted transcriptional regulator, contains HTH domain [Halobaculum gomorrense]
MTTGDATEIAGVIAKRRDILAALRDGPVRKRTLVDELGVPRTTLDRSVRELSDAGLAERADGGVRATTLGRNALDAHDRYRARLDGLARGEPLFDALPEETPLDGRFLAGASISEPDPNVPDGVVDRLFESVRNAEAVYGVAPAALTGHLDTFDDEATAGGAVPRMVVTPAVLDHLIDRRGERLAADLREGAFEFFCAPLEITFGLWVAAHDDGDDEAGIVVYTDTGVGGVAVNDAAEAVAWARERFERAREDAERITPEAVCERRGASSSEDESAVTDSVGDAPDAGDVR